MRFGPRMATANADAQGGNQVNWGDWWGSDEGLMSDTILVFVPDDDEQCPLHS